MTTTVAADALEAAHRPSSAEWLDRQSGRVMVLPAVIVLLCFAIFPLIISAYLALSRFALAQGGFTLKFIGLAQFQEAADRLAAIPSARHLRRARAARWLLLALVAAALLVLFWPATSCAAGRRSWARSAGCSRPRVAFVLWHRRGADLRARRRAGHGRQHAALRGRRRRRAVRARARPGAALRPADPRPQLLPRAVLRAADGDAGRHRLHLPHARRHAEGAVRAAAARLRHRASGPGRPRPGRRA